MQTASPTIRSNALTFPARSLPALPARRFGRPRQSSVYRLGVWLFNRAISIEPRASAALDAIKARALRIGGFAAPAGQSCTPSTT